MPTLDSRVTRRSCRRRKETGLKVAREPTEGRSGAHHGGCMQVLLRLLQGLHLDKRRHVTCRPFAFALITATSTNEVRHSMRRVEVPDGKWDLYPTYVRTVLRQPEKE